MPAVKKPLLRRSKPYCFVSYSSRESHISVLFPCLWIALSPHFDLRLTPSALESGAGQRSQIVDLIMGCTFAVVVLDGLRPNVTYEYGLLEAHHRPVILLKEKNATVDVKSLVGAETVTLGIAAPVLSIDSHFSDIKDVNYAEWNRLDPVATIKTIVQEYIKKRTKIEDFIDITEPDLWPTQ
jgi:hypothetical protein